MAWAPMVKASNVVSDRRRLRNKLRSASEGVLIAETPIVVAFDRQDAAIVNLYPVVRFGEHLRIVRRDHERYLVLALHPAHQRNHCTTGVPVHIGGGLV